MGSNNEYEHQSTNKKYYTRDGREIPKNEVVELDSEGYVLMSQKITTIDFTKLNDEQHNK